MNISYYIANHIDYISKSLNCISDNIFTPISDEILKIKKNNHKIFITGIGKNGHVAHKAASTFNSLSIPTFYINPVDAIHGDMGAITENDLLIAISKSGNTEELLLFLKYVQKKTKNIWLIHSNLNNNANQYCSNNIYINIENEADHLNMVPTVSILVYSILLQSIACYIADQTDINIKTFIMNHPGGSIGKIVI